MTKYFTWDEFDKSVEHVAEKCKFFEFSGIFANTPKCWVFVRYTLYYITYTVVHIVEELGR